MTPFHEHPPLALGLESLFFRVLGDGRWTERIFCLVAALGLILLIQPYIATLALPFVLGVLGIVFGFAAIVGSFMIRSGQKAA